MEGVEEGEGMVAEEEEAAEAEGVGSCLPEAAFRSRREAADGAEAVDAAEEEADVAAVEE